MLDPLGCARPEKEAPTCLPALTDEKGRIEAERQRQPLYGTDGGRLGDFLQPLRKRTRLQRGGRRVLLQGDGESA